MGKKKKRKEKKGKKPHKNKPTSKKYAAIASKKKHCIKCGPGIFLAEHKDRLACGKCGYTEFLKKA